MFTDRFLNNIIALIKRLVLITLLFTISRMIFFIVNYKSFTPLLTSELFRSFFFGIRFDLVVIYYINLVYLLFELLLYKFSGKDWFERIGKYLFITVNAVLLLLNLIDTGYFGFTNKRSGWEMLQMLTTSSDTLNLIPGYIINYWKLAALWISLVSLLTMFYPKYKDYGIHLPQYVFFRYLFVPVSIILFLGIGFAVARGIEGKPIRMISANKYVSSKYIPLVLNTPFTLINTINQYSLEDKEYFPLDELSDIYSPVQKFNYSESDFREKNVVLIILESFGKEYIEYKQDSISFTPFLDSLFDEGLYFENAFANAFRSMDALPAVISGFPSMMGTAYINSAYSVNSVSSLATILRFEKNYKTAFFHGGNNGTMGFDIFCKAADVEEYHGATEFGDEKYHDGSWGIYDEEFFQYMNMKLDNYNKPFFSVLFSLSSHDPYPIPEKYRNKFPEGPLPILKSIAYTDYSLNKMFQMASKMDWYENTLFIITADHTSIAIDKKYNTRIGRVRMPLFFFSPGDSALKGNSRKIVQHLDMVPSILDYIGYDKSFVSFGKSVFRSEGYDYSINYNDINYQIIDSAYCLLFDGENSIGLYNYINDELLNENLIDKREDIKKSLEKTLKAYVQNYTYRMNQNLLTGIRLISVNNK